MFDDCVEIFRGYGAVDDVLAQCERIGGQLNTIIASWSQDTRKGKEKATSDVVDGSDALSLVATASERIPKDFLTEQPRSLSKNVQLKGYQLLGVNWLRLLYKKGRSCILADEMGTVQSPLLQLYHPCLPQLQVWERLSRLSASLRTLGRVGRKGHISSLFRESWSFWKLFTPIHASSRHLLSVQILDAGKLGSGVCTLRAIHRCPDLLRWQGRSTCLAADSA